MTRAEKVPNPGMVKSSTVITGVSPDSVSYLAAARNLAAGRGYAATMLRVRRPALLLALLLFAAQLLLAWHGVEHLHAAPDSGDSERCMLCVSGSHALPAPASTQSAPPAATGNILPASPATPVSARPQLLPPVRGPPHYS